MTYRLTFTLPGLPKTANGSHGHWATAAHHRRVWRAAVVAAVCAKRPATPLERASLTLTRHSSAEPDRDNLASSFKSVIDGLVDARVIQDDKASVVGSPTFRWEKAPVRKGFISVLVEEMTT